MKSIKLNWSVHKTEINNMGFPSTDKSTGHFFGLLGWPYGFLSEWWFKACVHTPLMLSSSSHWRNEQGSSPHGAAMPHTTAGQEQVWQTSKSFAFRKAGRRVTGEGSIRLIRTHNQNRECAVDTFRTQTWLPAHYHQLYALGFLHCLMKFTWTNTCRWI